MAKKKRVAPPKKVDVKISNDGSMTIHYQGKQEEERIPGGVVGITPWIKLSAMFLNILTTLAKLFWPI